MDTLYKQDLREDITLSFVADDSSSKDTAIWHTYIYNKKLKITVPIDIFKYDKNFGAGWEWDKAIGEGAPFLINIVGAFADNHTLYVIYSTWGLVRLVVYTFTIEDKFTKQTYLIGRFFALGAYAGLSHFANFKLYGNKLFFYVKAGQQLGGDEGSIHFLGYYDTTYKELQQYQFSKKPKRIKDTQRIGDKIQRDLLLTEQNTYNLITLSMKQLLVDEGKIKHPNYFEYLFTIDGCSNNERTRDGGDMLYIFYREELHYGDIKIMQYDNGYPDYAWLIDDSVTRRTIEPIKIPNK